MAVHATIDSETYFSLPEAEAAHFTRCCRCFSWFDCRRLHAVLQHERCKSRLFDERGKVVVKAGRPPGRKNRVNSAGVALPLIR